MEDEEFKKLPTDERCVHKLWKARVSGYEEVTKIFRQADDDKSPEFAKYLGLVKKFVTDSNAMGQEKGLEATIAFVENYAHAGKSVGEVMSGVVTKCIAAPKTRTRELALQLTLMYIEIEKFEAVEDELVKGMEQKNPKIVAACINACTLALREFGSKIINVKPLVKKIGPLFADRDKGVRDEARQMVIEIYKWIGGALRSQLNNLQPVQVTELEAEFSKIDGVKATPTRYIRSQQQRQEATVAEVDDVQDGDPSAEEGDCESAQQMDPYDLADPVDVLSKLPKDFYEEVEAKKWQERKKVLECVENLVKTPRLETGDYGDLVRALKKVIQKDTNVLVVAIAGRCIASIASGLRKNFHVYAGACVPALLEKFKEKKQSVVTAIRDAIDAVYSTTTIEAIQEDVVEALANKNPAVKSETSFFLARSFVRTVPTALNKKILKILTTALVKNINEPDPTVRDSAAEAIGTLMKLVGEKAIGPFLVELEKDNLKMSKIKECCEKAVILVKVSVAKKERPPTAPARSVSKPVSKSGATAPRSAPAQTNPTSAAKKKTETVSKSKAVKPKGKAVSKNSKPTEKELSEDEVEECASGLLSESLRAELTDGNWKTRLETMKQMLTLVQSSNDFSTQVLVRVLLKKPGLKDTNFQVLKLKLDLIKYMAESMRFSSTAAKFCITDIADKFGDVKNGTSASETMTAVAEAAGFPFVSASVLEYAVVHKNPKVVQESLIWLSEEIKEFGFGGLDVKLLIDNTRKTLACTNPGVRQAAITLCGVLYLYVGNTLHTFFEDEKPILRDQINAEFEKYEGIKPPSPTRGVISKSPSEDNLDEDDDAGGDDNNVAINIQDLLPRVDISSQITETLLNEIEDKNWKVRIEGLTKVSAILKESQLIKPSIGDLPSALVHRLSDSNTKIAQTALNICDTIAKAMGPPCKQYIRMFFPCFLQSLGDNKSWMRTTSLETINTYVEQCGYKEFFEGEMVADALKNGSPMLRVELWGWLAEHLVKVPVRSIPKEELAVCVPHLYSNLEDRNADVRKNAQEAILGIMIHLGYEGMAKQTEKLSLGSKKNIQAALEKTRPNLPVKPLVTKKQTSSADKEDKGVRGTKAIATSKNTVKPKSSGGTVKAAPVSSRKKDDDIDLSPLLVVSNMKHQRTIDETKMKVLKWNFITPREEFVELLSVQMTAANVNKTLMFNMFHTDFRYHLKALESLVEDLPGNTPALIANLDLILKWLTLRFFDTNPSVLLKGLEYLNSVFSVLIGEDYRMLDNEASAFLPYLIVKIGDPKDAVRNGVRGLIKQMYFLYPTGRLCSYIMEGLKSKNARQRAECLEMMGSMIRDYGTPVFPTGPAACLKEVAKQISDRDNSVRNAALNCMVEAYQLMGEKLYKTVGNISDKDLTLLEERIKRSNRRTNIVKPPSKSDVCSPAIANLCQEEESPSRNGSGDEAKQPEPPEEEEEAELPPVRMPVQVIPANEVRGPFCLDADLLRKLDSIPPIPSMLKVQEFDLDFLHDNVNIPPLQDSAGNAKIMPLSPPKPLDPNVTMSKLVHRTSPMRADPVLLRNIAAISSTDMKSAMQAIDQVVQVLQHAKVNSITEHEDELMTAIAKQLKQLRNLDPRSDRNVARLFRNVLSLVDAFYNDKTVRKGVSVNVLMNVMNEFISVLVDGKLEGCPEGDAYVRVVNLHCVKVIERSDHTAIICALIKLIYTCIRDEYSSRHTELVMKCLWRIIKQMPLWDDDVDYDSVLLEVHNFLKEFPSSWWKTQPMDTTLRTIKTIMHSSVKIKGGSITLHLSKIPNTSESEVEAYILKLLKTMKVEEVKQVPLKQENHQRRSLSRATHSTLSEIFQKIGSKEETKDGLNLLYNFLEQNPEADIDPFLNKSSKFFQDYIRRGLKEIEEVRGTPKSTREKVEEKTTRTTVASHSQKDAVEAKGPDYWREKLSLYKQMWDEADNNMSPKPF